MLKLRSKKADPCTAICTSSNFLYLGNLCSRRNQTIQPAAEPEQSVYEGSSNRINPTKPSIISEGFEFVGTITSEGVLNISGVIKGKVTAKSVLVDSTGLVEGELFSDQVMVKGKVLGDINCDELNIGPLAEVDGSVSYESVHIQRGGKIKGHFIKK
jgi:cytoskeletal protein CcmA (bactofilin family)